MIDLAIPVYLASKSPRRKQILNQIGLKFKIAKIDLDEEFFDNESPIKTVKRIAAHKISEAKLKLPNDGIIITADTIVVLDGKMIGKPKDKNEAVKILKKLSNNTHFVYTGYAVCNCLTGKEIVNYRKSEVTFRELSNKEIKNYVADGSPLDKAGAYGIQDDYGAVFVKNIKGCYYNIMGLPIHDVFLAIKNVAL